MRNLHWRLICVALTVAVSALALLPQPPEALTSGWDKANHALAFAALCASGRLGWPALPAPWQALVWLGYGGLIELLQTQLPPRQGEAADLLADALGIALGFIAASAWRRLRAP
jgi:VanZ family protein